MRRATIILAVLLIGCGETADTTSTLRPPVTATSLQSTTTIPPPTIGCPEDVEFVGEGRIARITQPTSDSRKLGLISIQTSEGCEKFGFDFDTVENAPATTPPSVDAEFLEGGRIVRIRLDIDQTVITDQLAETTLVDRLFVVRSLDGSMFVDVHLARAARARVNVTNSPAGLTLELSPRDGDLSPAAAISESTVLIQPSNESVVDGPEVELSGYARVFEANVLILASSGGTVMVSTNTTAADSVATWGEFTADVELPAGLFDVFVGEETPDDGSLDGITLKLTVR